MINNKIRNWIIKVGSHCNDCVSKEKPDVNDGHPLISYSIEQVVKLDIFDEIRYFRCNILKRN